MRPLRILALALCAVAAAALTACLLTESDHLLLPAALAAAVVFRYGAELAHPGEEMA